MARYSDTNSGRAGRGIFVAGFAAGPLVVLLSSLAALYLQLPAPIQIQPYAVTFGIVVLPFASMIGAAIAVPVNAIGMIVMGWLARHVFWARSGPSWALAGGLLASPVAANLGGTAIDADSVRFGIVATAMLCGLICHHHAYAKGEAPSPRNVLPSARVIP